MQAVHAQSLDEDNRRFAPDEVFETLEEAAETVEFLMGCCASGEGPLGYPVLQKDGTIRRFFTKQIRHNHIEHSGQTAQKAS